MFESRSALNVVVIPFIVISLSFHFYNFDIILSLYSLDYHYDFNVYKEYLKNISSDQTQIVFDTVRPDYFNNIFDEVKIITTIEKKIHSSKRIICRGFIK